jgi:hypothetical protein
VPIKHRRERATDQQLREADAEQRERDQDRGQPASRTMAQRDEGRVRRADLRLQGLACPAYQPGGGRVRE